MAFVTAVLTAATPATSSAEGVVLPASQDPRLRQTQSLLVASMLFLASCPVVLNSCLFGIIRGQNILIVSLWKPGR